jgi:hypothetical protein
VSINVENILKVADAIEQHSIPDLGFNMKNWFNEAGDGIVDNSGHNCGTVACIAGWTAYLAKGSEPTHAYWTYKDGHTSKIAREFLGLSRWEAGDLFEPGAVAAADWGSIKPSQAVAVIRHLAATGEVDWSIGAPE